MLGVYTVSSFAQKTLDQFFAEGKAKLDAKDYDGAFAAFDQVIALDANHVFSHSYQALIKRIKKNYDGAIASYTRAIESAIAKKDRPDNYADFYIHRGRVHLDNKNDPDEAIKDFTKGLAIDVKENSYRYYYFRARAYTVKGNHEAAIADLSDAIRTSPSPNATYYRLRAESYRRVGKTVLAEADERQAASIQP